MNNDMNIEKNDAEVYASMARADENVKEIRRLDAEAHLNKFLANFKRLLNSDDKGLQISDAIYVDNAYQFIISTDAKDHTLIVSVDNNENARVWLSYKEDDRDLSGREPHEYSFRALHDEVYSWIWLSR